MAAAQSWTYGASGVSTAAWNGAGVLTDSVTSGGAVTGVFAGAVLASLAGPSPLMSQGAPV